MSQEFVLETLPVSLGCAGGPCFGLSTHRREIWEEKEKG